MSACQWTWVTFLPSHFENCITVYLWKGDDNIESACINELFQARFICSRRLCCWLRLLICWSAYIRPNVHKTWSKVEAWAKEEPITLWSLSAHHFWVIHTTLVSLCALRMPFLVVIQIGLQVLLINWTQTKLFNVPLLFCLLSDNNAKAVELSKSFCFQLNMIY